MNWRGPHAARGGLSAGATRPRLCQGYASPDEPRRATLLISLYSYAKCVHLYAIDSSAIEAELGTPGYGW